LKIFVSLALALGLTTAVVGTSSAAQAAPATGVTRAAAACQAERAVLDSARAKRQGTKQRLTRAQRARKRTAVQLRRAKANGNQARTVRLQRKLRGIDRRLTVLQRRSRNQARAVQAAREVLAECVNGTGGAESPIQDLCDAGLPQALCDTLGGLVPGGGPASPLQAVCDALTPLQPLCDAADRGLPSSPAALFDVVRPLLSAAGLDTLIAIVEDLLAGGRTLQALCDAGLPQQVCEALAGDLPTSISVDAFCEAVGSLPGARQFCTAVAGAGLPSPDVLMDLVQPIIDALGLRDLLRDLLDDLLGGLLGGLFPRQVAA